jgi:glycerol-3-phosphate acyltransferase PlsY
LASDRLSRWGLSVTDQISPILPFSLAVGYLLGSIPFGLILTKFAGTGDIRNIGSGNIGATNVLRTGRKGLAAATLFCDVLKGTAAVLVMDRFAGLDAALVAGLGAVLGHVFPIWLRFKGGKGVATYIGVLIAVSWPAAAAFGVIWAAVAALTRYSSLSALLASAMTPVLLWFLASGKAMVLFAALTLIVWIMHRGNIARLAAGTEPKIGRKADSAPGV